MPKFKLTVKDGQTGTRDINVEGDYEDQVRANAFLNYGSDFVSLVPEEGFATSMMPPPFNPDLPRKNAFLGDLASRNLFYECGGRTPSRR